MKRIAVTGATGFLGKQFADHIDTHSGWQAVRIDRSHFEADSLPKMLRGCRAVFHFAGESRSAEPEKLYDVNMRLTRQLLAAVEANREPIAVFFASTTHEEKESCYHASKRDGRRLIEERARRAGYFRGIGVLIPNVFGPGGKPFYNSVTSTFCWQVAHGETPVVNPGAGKTRLIYIDTLLKQLFEMAVSSETCISPVVIADEFEVDVAVLAARLQALQHGAPATGVLEQALVTTLKAFSIPEEYGKA